MHLLHCHGSLKSALVTLAIRRLRMQGSRPDIQGVSLTSPHAWAGVPAGAACASRRVRMTGCYDSLSWRACGFAVRMRVLP
jgi:hypothetical protein